MKKIKLLALLGFSASAGYSQCLVGNLPFSGNGIDVTTNGNDATSGGAVLGTDRFGSANSCYVFDGVDDYLESPTTASTNFNELGSFSIALWFKSNDPDACRLLNHATFQVGMEITYYNDSIRFYWGDDNSFVVWEPITGGGVFNDTWHQLVVTFNNSTMEVRGYIDGVYQNLPMNVNGGTGSISSTTPWVYGAYADYTGNFHGSLDDVKFFDCALTPAQIDAMYQAEAAVSPCGLQVNDVVSAPSCYDGNNGGIDVTIMGGAPPYITVWSNGQMTEDLGGLSAGTYTLIVVDDNGCEESFSYGVPDGPQIGISLTTTQPSCGQNNGNAIATLTGGTAPFDYNWSSGDTLSTADSLTAGIYMLTVTDANGCTSSTTFGMNNTSGPVLSAVAVNPSCAGVFDGAIDLSVSGGTAPYSYSWSNAATTQDILLVKPGAYMVQVTDATGCMSILTVQLTAPSINLSNFTITPSTCGNSDGVLSISPSGGLSPYSYSWSANAGGATTSTVSGLGADSYSVTVSDANGCSASTTLMLSDDSAPTIQTIAVNSADCTGGTGSINIGIAAGVPPFTYDWSNGSTNQDLVNLDAGHYTVNISDGNGCIAMYAIDVPSRLPDPITLCVSTVDSITGKVLCVWEKQTVGHISHFNIYRENAIAGQYDFWFSKPYDSLSQWTDQTANPLIRGWRYKVTQVDTCGNESDFGINHKTIHLTANNGPGGVINLIWDDYEGFAYPTIYINRYHPSTGWELIDSVPSTLHSYTDLTPPTGGSLLYTVDARPPSTCTSTRAINHNSTRSNRGTVAAPLPSFIGENGILSDAIELYPNPNNGRVTIRINEATSAQVEIYDMHGKLVYSGRQSSTEKEHDLTMISNGIYLVRVYCGEKTYHSKLIKH